MCQITIGIDIDIVYARNGGTIVDYQTRIIGVMYRYQHRSIQLTNVC
jgi:hypothetical protein